VRLFAAVWPPADVCARLKSLTLGDLPKLRTVPDGSWHVTLSFFGETDDDTALDRALAVAASTLRGPVTADVGPHTERMGRRVLCVPVRGLDEVAEVVRRETAASTGSDDARFTGHLTVARGRGKSPVPLAAVGIGFEASFEVRAFSLVESTLGPDGPSYRDRATYVLGGSRA
jgi:2'-5' RNA ligase